MSWPAVIKTPDPLRVLGNGLKVITLPGPAVAAHMADAPVIRDNSADERFPPAPFGWRHITVVALLTTTGQGNAHTLTIEPTTTGD
jgi:hypothetical protein